MFGATDDILEILDEIQELVNRQEGWANLDYLTNELNEYISNKRLEFVEPQGDCCGGWNEDRIDVVGQNGNTGDHY